MLITDFKNIKNNSFKIMYLVKQENVSNDKSANSQNRLKILH